MTMQEKLDSLQRIVEYGLANGKKNVIADFDVLYALYEQNALLRQALDQLRRGIYKPLEIDEIYQD